MLNFPLVNILVCRIDVGRGSESFVALVLSIVSYARKRTGIGAFCITEQGAG